MQRKLNWIRYLMAFKRFRIGSQSLAKLRLKARFAAEKKSFKPIH